MTEKTSPFILGFYGSSGVGKTTLVTRIVELLTNEGFHVAVIKISNQAISIDSKGKDTYLYGEAGADTVVFSSASESAVLFKKPLSTGTIVKFLNENENYDFIFIEGAMEDWIPKIRLGEMDTRANTLFTYDGNFENLYTKIKQHKIL